MPIDSNIRHHIKQHSHIKIDDMMRFALSTSNESYYRSVKTLGKDGDFITAPEISQLFGEAIALWAIEKWQALGSPDKLSLIELGAGRGKLMQDFLKVAQLVPKFFSSIELFLYEINPNFIDAQKSNLSKYKKNITWIKNLDAIPKIPTIILANEFFDALPIKQYIKIKDKWFESTLVTDPIDGRLKFSKVAIHKTLQTQLLIDHQNAQDGATIEESIESMHIIRQLSLHLKKHTGAALAIDYGYNIETSKRTRNQYNSTLQAIKNHQYCSIIDTLGEADLTAHVDFDILAKSSKEQGINIINFSNQQDFLIKYGINIRKDMLKKSISTEDFNIIENQVFRLTSPKQMGELFKVLELVKL